MQFLFDFHDEADRLQEIHSRLDIYFAESRVKYVRLNPVSQLVMSSLGGRTRSEVSRAAFIRLLRRFGSWSRVRDAGEGEVLSLVDTVTYAENKVVYLQEALTLISSGSGKPSLDWLAPLQVDLAHTTLRKLPGVGPKVASAVLNFSTLRRRNLVVDSHHLRVTYRLGLLRNPQDYDLGYRRLMPLVPGGWTAAQIDHHHCIVKTLGQTLCTYSRPTCEICPLRRICPSAEEDSLHIMSGAPMRGRHARFTPKEAALVSDLTSMP